MTPFVASIDSTITLAADDAPENPYVSDGVLWIVAHHAKTVVRADALTGQHVVRITADESPGGIVAGAGLIWVTHYTDPAFLIAIDPATNRVVRRITLPGESCCQPAVLGSTVWVAASRAGEVAIVAVDAKTGKVGKRIVGVDNPVTVGTALWASRGRSELVILNPATGQITPTAAPAGTILTASPPIDGLTWGWANGSIVGIGADGAVRRTVTGRDGRSLGGADGVVVTSGSTVWATDGSSTLWRFNAADEDSAIKVADLAPDLLSIAGDGRGGVWLASFGTDRVVHYTVA